MSAPSKVYRLTSGERAETLARVARFLNALPTDKAFDITIAQHRPRRSNEQNSLMWALYAEAIKRGGEELGGWESEDLHEYLLGEHYGWSLQEGLGAKRKKPLRRSSSLNKQEMTDHIDFIVRRMAEHGVVLDLPGDDQH